MARVNDHKLSDHIPVETARLIRQQSRFGCVICRSGFYQYEHIDPTFEEAVEHNADNICCLCGSCHDAVTRGRWSKSKVKEAYQKIRSLPIADVAPPKGPLDFHDGRAELVIGGISYSPAVQTILRYHGFDLIRLDPGENGEPGRISALFTDSLGCPTLQLVDNAFIGSLTNWDIQTVKNRITVSRSSGQVVLQLRLDPPGRIVVERLDMRFRRCHVLATEHAHAIGTYLTDQVLAWASVELQIGQSNPAGAAIEYADSETILMRQQLMHGAGQGMASDVSTTSISSVGGILVPDLGIVFASLCGGFAQGSTVINGHFRLADMSEVLFNRPDSLHHFIAHGTVTPVTGSRATGKRK